MGKTSIPDKFVDQRGSRRLYALDLPFREAMKKRPAREDPDYSWRKQSEFKKPYKSPNYQAMEYRFDAPPGFGIDWPDWGGGEYPPALDGAPEGVWNANFLCSGDPCYCPGETKCFDLGCTWQVIAINVIRGRITVSGRNYACITAPEDFHGTAEIQVMQDWGKGSLLEEGERVYGSHVMIVEECDEDECCPCSGETINYTDADMSLSGSDTLTINDQAAGNECYTWKLTGSGFTFNGGVTTVEGENSVTLNAPAANANCANSATVTLECKSGTVLDTVDFSASTNAYPGYVAYYHRRIDCGYYTNGQAQCGDATTPCAHPYCWACCGERFDCEGNTLGSTPLFGTWRNSPPYTDPTCDNGCYNIAPDYFDVRDPAHKAGGCCPVQVA